MAIGGSTNAALHLPAIAHAAGVRLSAADFDAAADVPTLLGIVPNGPWGIYDMFVAGGMPAVLKRLAPLLDTSCMTVTGQPLADTLERAVVKNPRVIPPLTQPFRPKAGIVVLRGNLAPDTAVIKSSGVDGDMLVCSGPARCFDTEVDAQLAINRGEVADGSVIVLRYLGPKGAPGMPEMLAITASLKLKGLRKTALVTDGRFSGGTNGPCVGHVCPEASDGGPIALVQDGDIIEIDIPAKRLTLRVDEATLAARRAAWTPVLREAPHGFLQRYRRHVRPASEGAVLD
jgi:dihydroxy-acid dehydratase